MRRRKSQGKKFRGVYLRGNIYWYQRMVNGQRIQTSLGTSDYGEAVTKALEIRADPFLAAAEPLESEIDRFVIHKVDQNEYSVASADSKKYVLREFARFVGKPDSAGIFASDVERFYRVLKDRVAESTAQGYITTLRSFFNWLKETKKVRRNIVQDVKLARLDSHNKKRFCTPEERDKLIDRCKRDDLKFVLFCGFHAGMRKQEIVEARPEWFNLKQGVIHIRRTETFRPKDREDRFVPMRKSFKAFLKKYGVRSPFMLHPEVPHGKSRYRWDFRRPWTEHVAKHNYSWVTPHIARHTFASLLASAGKSIYKIAVWLGDDVRVVQKHYAKLLPKDEDIEENF